ncbi:MAG: MYXO-CTERM sorting domain-containing protein [Myxococcota bacterium]
MFVRILVACLCLSFSSAALAQAASTPGTAVAPHPTLENIAVEWPVSGDDNHNGSVSVRYREVGGNFRPAMPLMHVPAGSNEGFSWAHRHAGSIFGLQPDTAYEVELTLSDPDGGGATTTLQVRTRKAPAAAPNARRVEVTPASLAGALSGLQAGDLLVLSPGNYPAITIAADGNPDRPIVLRGTDVAGVVVGGDVRIDGRSHVSIEHLTVNGQIKFNDADHIAVIGCQVNAGMGQTGDGIVSFGNGSTDGYFADNVVIGRTVWAEASLGVNGNNIGEGIEMSGPGNVIEHNRVSGFRDCLSLMEDGEAVDQVAVDFLYNDLDNCADDAIEADFSMGNVRVIGNRISNSFMGLSSQPSLGGPAYFLRNVMYSVVFQAFKPHRGSIGDYWIHNTVVKPGDGMGVFAGTTWSSAFFRNNLIIGGLGGGDYNGFNNGDGAVIDVADADSSCDFDYDGYGAEGTGTFKGRIGGDRFTSFAGLTGSGHEAHAVQVGLSSFAAAISFPEHPFPALPVPDLRIKAQGAAVDRGVALPNINDGFAGAAPDLGAYEVGATLPNYGPRTGAQPEVDAGVGPAADAGAQEVDAGMGAPDAAAPGADASSSNPDASTSGPDAGASNADAGAPAGDAGNSGLSGKGCGCETTSSGAAPIFGLFLLALAAATSRRRS